MATTQVRAQRKMKKDYSSFETYITQLVKGHSGGGFGITGKGLAVLDSITKNFAAEISEHAKRAAKSAGRKTILTNDIILAIKLAAPHGLGKEMEKATSEALKKYSA